MHSSAAPIVRIATEADVDAIVNLIAAVADEGRWIATEAPVDHAHRRQGLLQLLQRGDAKFRRDRGR